MKKEPTVRIVYQFTYVANHRGHEHTRRGN